jgi:hypothetical protein
VTLPSAALAFMVILALYVCMTMVLLRQNGRLLSRLDSLEARAQVDLDDVRPRFNEGDRVPLIRLPDLDGSPVGISEVRGNTVLLFWDPGNGRCQSMIPDIQSFERIRPSGAPGLILISRGEPGTHRAYGFASPVLLDRENVSGTVFGVTSFPSAIMFDGHGRFTSDMATNYVSVFQLIGLVPFVPTEDETVTAMLDLATVTSDDVVYDLGCGDGRIVIAAAERHGARGVGVDINPERIEECRLRAKTAGIDPLVRFERADLFDADIREATVVTLYLLPSVNLRLRAKLQAELRPGTRVVSHGFDMDDWKAEREMAANGATLYLWMIGSRP